ncbi:MAG: GNAT family N-acetyltransferase, partial [Burkholderiales bacterium]
MTKLRVEILETLAEIDPAAWNALALGHPFLRHEFLHALHETKCACADTGWQPQFVTAWQGRQLVGALPLYLKSHSRGEYVFDWAWADAYERHGMRYYPKLLAAIPFSPVSAPKILAATDTIRMLLADTALELAKQVSSLHILFPTETEQTLLADRSMMIRRGVQFHWTNEQYRDFDDFPSRLSHDKRKKIKQERRKVRDAGVTFERKTGADITAADWAFFHKCYRTTYREHHSSPYLNLPFFERLGATMSENMLVIIASREGAPIAAALNIFAPEILYGRYWGTLEFHSALHFEACYYQAL